MAEVNMPYVDTELEHLTRGVWHFSRHFHWGYFTDPEVDDDSPERYLAAAEALTEELLTLAGITDNTTIGDVGCGFGGTLDHLRNRNHGCRLYGLNIDHRQLQAARQLLTQHDANDDDGGAPDTPLHFITADGCRLPYPDNTFDHLLAVECIFHFPSRKAFFKEAARTLKPGGTLALSDFLIAPDALPHVAANATSLGDWIGHLSKPLTTPAYERLGRGTGLGLAHEVDITTQTLPTYPALRNLFRLTKGPQDEAERAIAGLTSLEALSAEGHLRYELLAFHKQVRS